MARIEPGMESDMMSRREQIGLARRGVYEAPVAGWTAGRYANPARIAGTVPSDAGEVGRGYVRPNPASWMNNPPPAGAGGAGVLAEMRGNVDRILGTQRGIGGGMPPDTRPIIGGMPQFAGGMVGAGGRSAWSGARGAGGGSMLSGMPEARGMIPERPPDPVESAPAGAPPSSWGGTMSPITLRPGVGLMEMKPRFGEYMRDERVLAARRAEFDRNLGNYLKDRPPTWQSRAEYEREIAGLAGAGEEILPHIQQRANESMPVRLAQDWQAEEAERKASEQALITSRARSAAEQDWLNRAPPGAREALEQNYISTPSGFKRIGMTPWEKSEAGYEEFRRTATPEEMVEFRKNYEQTPMGWRRKWMPGQDAVESTSDRPPSGAPPAGASVVVPPQRPAEFRTEAEAVAAGLPPGTKVFINGRPAIIE